jgi:hypothetical protein
MPTITLKITNCLDCPHHKRYPSVIFDSWDLADEDVVCTKAPGNHKIRGGTVKGKAVSVSERYETQRREECEVPKWCPLLKKKP